MEKLGINLLYRFRDIKFSEIYITMVQMGDLSRNGSQMKLFESTEQLEYGGEESLAQKIQESKYRPPNLEEVAMSRFSLSPKQRGFFILC